MAECCHIANDLQLDFTLSLLGVGDDGRPNGGYGRFNRGNLQDGDEPFPGVILALWMAPSVGFDRFGVSSQGKYLNEAFPDRLGAKDFMHRRGFNPSRIAPVQLRDDHF
jgi:hypothetical protein